MGYYVEKGLNSLFSDLNYSSLVSLLLSHFTVYFLCRQESFFM